MSELSFRRAGCIGIIAGLVMSGGYVFLFILVALANRSGYYLESDYVNSPGPQLAIIFYLCQVGGTALLSLLFLSARELWKVALVVALALPVSLGLAYVFPPLRHPMVLPFLGYALVGATLGIFMMGWRGAVLLMIASPILYVLAALTDAIFKISETLVSLVPRYASPPHTYVFNELVAQGSAGQLSINIIYALLIAFAVTIILRVKSVSDKSCTESDIFYLPRATIGQGQIVSPDSTRLAYAVQDRHGIHVEVNGRGLHSYDATLGITFSPDSRRIAYVASRNNNWFVVFDEVECAPWDDIGTTSPVISPDSNHIAYTARKENKWFAVLDGETIGGPYEGFLPGGIVFSPDSRRTVYVVKKGNSWLAIVDGKEQEAFPAFLKCSHTFSPDSKKVVYVACITGSWMGNALVGEAAVVINGELQRPWKHDGATNQDGLFHEVYFSPDSQRIAYQVMQNDKRFFVVDDVPQKGYDGLVSGWSANPNWTRFPGYGKASCKSDGLVFSPDSLHFAYAVAEENQHLLIYDGEERGRHQAILNKPVVFSPNSERLAYGIEKGSKQILIVDWIEQKAYHGIPPIAPCFSPDSKHVAYVAWNWGRHLLVIDTQEWTLPGVTVVGSKLVWDDPEHGHTLVTRGRKVMTARFSLSPQIAMQAREDGHRTHPLLEEREHVLDKRVEDSGDRLCDWIMTRIKQKAMSGEELVRHIDHCPTCSQFREKRKEGTTVRVKVDPENFPTLLLVWIDGPFHLDQVLFKARRRNEDLVVMGNRSPATKNPNVLFTEASKFLRDPDLVLIFEKWPSRLDPFCMDPLVIVRRTFLLEAASALHVQTLGELAIELVQIASRKNLKVSYI